MPVDFALVVEAHQRLQHVRFAHAATFVTAAAALANGRQDSLSALQVRSDETDLSQVLFDKYRIYTAGVDNVAGNVVGARVTPHVFIQPKELDTLVAAITEIARSAWSAPGEQRPAGIAVTPLT